MKNRRVTVFRMDKKKNEKCIIKKNNITPTCSPHPLATLPFPIPTPTGCIIKWSKKQNNGSLSSYEANSEITTLISCEFGVDPLYKIIILTHRMSHINCTLLCHLWNYFFMNLLMAGLFLCISSSETFMTTNNE